MSCGQAYRLTRTLQITYRFNSVNSIRSFSLFGRSTPRSPVKMSSDMESFHAHLKNSNSILTLIGAGLSASSGLPTFRGAGGMWKNYEATLLATPEAFAADPGLVWQFYAYRRHMALKAKPNPAHFALAELGRVMDKGGHGQYGGSLTLSQNVDGLSPRANHPEKLLKLLHGSLFDIKCSNKRCDYVDINNFTDPICPALEVSNVSPLLPSSEDKTGEEATSALYNSMNLPDTPTSSYSPNIPDSDLPHCPKCNSLLRPGVVWFGEALPEKVITTVGGWIAMSPKIDIMLVIGTTAEVWPAAGYIMDAREKGARVVVVNMDSTRLGAGGNLDPEMDWLFEGDAGELVPKLLEPRIGKLDYAKLGESA